MDSRRKDFNERRPPRADIKKLQIIIIIIILLDTPFRWGLKYDDCILYRGVNSLTSVYIFPMTLNYTCGVKVSILKF